MSINGGPAFAVIAGSRASGRATFRRRRGGIRQEGFDLAGVGGSPMRIKAGAPQQCDPSSVGEKLRYFFAMEATGNASIGVRRGSLRFVREPLAGERLERLWATTGKAKTVGAPQADTGPTNRS